MLLVRPFIDLTLLNFNKDRLALVTEMVFHADAPLAGATVYRARVRNKAKLAYDAIRAWINERSALPLEAARAPGLQAQLQAQAALA